MSALHYLRRGLSLMKLGALKLLAWPIRRRLYAFEAATYQPREVQEAVLRGILELQADTDFARDHGLSLVRSVEEFRRQVPVAGYEYVEPYLARVRRGDLRALLGESRVHLFALTSGTTAGRKTIPVTDRYLADYKRGWELWGLKALREHKPSRLQPILQLVGDMDEMRTESGVPCGAVTGLTAATQKRIIRWLYCVPACVGRIKDTRAKFYAALRTSLLRRRLGMVISANPSTLVNLARVADAEKEALIRDIHDGTLRRDLELAPEIRRELERRLRPRQARARELEAVVATTGHLYPKDAWPAPFLLGNWTGGSVGVYLRHFPRYYGDNPVRDIGLLASEGRMTIPFSDRTPAGVLDIQSHYFEFIPEAEGDSPQPTVLGAHEVCEGASYYILMTTGYGLYRYHIRDLVRVVGFHNATPVVEFLSKGAHFANLTGEKLSEWHVTQAMADVLAEMNLTLGSYGVAPCVTGDEEFILPNYGLFVEGSDLNGSEVGERLAQRLDERLQELNAEYECKRSSQRLGALTLEVVPPGFWGAWDRERLLRTGGTLEQYKHPCLINDLAFAGQAREACRL